MHKESEWQIVVSNNQETLADALCEEFFSPHTLPFENRLVVVPHASLKDFLMRHFAEHPRLQIAAGVQVLPLNQAILEIFDVAACPKKRIPSFAELSLAIEEILHTASGREFAPLLDYVGTEKKNQRIAKVSDVLAQCFGRYGLYGKTFLPEWLKKEGWQQTVWRTLFPENASWTFPLEYLQPAPFQGKIALFGFSFLSPAHLSFFSQLSATLYHLSPCALFYGDFVSERQRLSAQRFFQRKGSKAVALEELDGYMRQGHPLLRNWGRLGREMNKTLDAFLCEEKEVYQEELPAHLLGRLQASLLTLEEAETLPSDNSIQLHSATTKLREVEAVRDTLRALLYEEKIHLRDIIVACPSISDYAPYIHMVFADSGLPYAIEGLPLESQSETVRGWMQLMDLPKENYALSSVLKVLRCPAFMEKRGFSMDEVNRLGKWFKMANIRNGLTGHSNSWEEGLDRLLFGLAIVPDDNVVYDAYPLAAVAESEIDLFNKFLEFFNALKEDLTAFTGIKSASEWLELFLHIAEKYFLIEMEREPIFQELKSLAHSCRSLNSAALGLESITRVLNHLCEKATGKMGVARQEKIAFVPLSHGYIRSAQILWCLGMDEEAYPRSDPSRSLCELQGDYAPSRGEEDRSLFLDMLTLAKRHLIFSYPRIHAEDGKHQGPSLLIDELKQYLAKRGSGVMQVDHSALPAKAHCSTLRSPFFHFKPFGPIAPVEVSIDIRQLKKLARHPLQFFFNETLKIYLNEEEDEEETEFFLSNLRKSMMRTQMLHGNTGLMHQMKAQGMMPRGLFQQAAVRGVEEEMEILFTQLTEFGVKTEEIRSVSFTTAPITLALNDTTVVHITGELEDVTPQGLLAHVDSNLTGLVRAWPLYLIYRCIDSNNRTLLLTKKGHQKEFVLEDPKAALTAYLEYFLFARQRPSLLMPQCAKALLEGSEEQLIADLSKETSDLYLNYLQRRGVFADLKEALALWSAPLKKAFAPLLQGGSDAL